MRGHGVVVVLFLAGCASTQAGPSSIDQFRADTSPAVVKMGNAFNQVSNAAKEQDWTSARKGCDELDGARLELESKLPSPAEDLTKVMNNLTHTLYEAVGKCRTFGPANTPSDVSEWNLLLGRADAETKEATRIMDGLTAQ